MLKILDAILTEKVIAAAIIIAMLILAMAIHIRIAEGAPRCHMHGAITHCH